MSTYDRHAHPVRRQFMDGLSEADATETRRRLVEVKAAVAARLDELANQRRHDIRHDLQIGLDRVNTRMLEASKLYVETLANALSESHGETPMPMSQPGLAPRIPMRKPRP